MVVGTLTDALDEAAVTEIPPAGARPLRRTVADVGEPPKTLAGESRIETRTGGWINNRARAGWPELSVTLNDACAAAAMGVVLSGMDAFAASGGTATDDGTDMAPTELATNTVAPDGGERPSSFNVAVADCPPTTLAGAMVTDSIVAGVNVSVVVADPAVEVARIVTADRVATPLVRTVNDAVVPPTATVTGNEATTDKAPSAGDAKPASATEELESVTVVPPFGVGEDSVRVPSTAFPPAVVDRDSEIVSAAIP